MHGREKLEAIMISANGDSGYMYEKDDADKVMDAMEARIKELESIPHTDNTAVIDNLQARIKKLEHQVMTDCTCDSSKSATLRMDLYKAQEYIKELEATISKMETTTPKWISVKDRFPCEDGEYQVVYKHKNGAMVSSFDEWDNDCQDWMNATDRSAVVFWAELLPTPPTTEENK